MTHPALDEPESFQTAMLEDVEDPYPIFDVLREPGSSVATNIGYHIVTGYDTAKSVLRDDRFSSGRIGDIYQAALPDGAAQDRLANRINFSDPPDHTRVRGLIVKEFTPQRVQTLRPWVEDKANELLDDIETRLERDETVDIRSELSHEVPSAVISELLGVPEPDRQRLGELAEAVTPLLNPQVDTDEREAAIEASAEFAEYASELIDDRRADPDDDLLSDLIHVSDGQQELAHEELESLFITLYSAGHRTTRDLFSNGLYVLLNHSEQYQAVVDDPGLLSDAIQEFLRYETPTLYAGRVATEDVTLEGTTVRAGTPTLVMLGAANRDPETYADPHRFDIRRDGPESLSFAAGRHRCLGAPLATMEAEVMLEAVTQRFPDLAVASPEPAWWNVGPFRGLDQLPVRLAEG